MSKKHGVDIFCLPRASTHASQERKRKEGTQLLQSIGVEEIFVEGSVRINWKTCRGVRSCAYFARRALEFASSTTAFR